MILTALLLAVVLGAATGALWAGLDVFGYRLTRNYIQETQITSIIRMVIAGIVAQNLATMLVVGLFHAVPTGGISYIIQIVLSILVYMNARVYLDSPY